MLKKVLKWMRTFTKTLCLLSFLLLEACTTTTLVPSPLLTATLTPTPAPTSGEDVAFRPTSTTSALPTSQPAPFDLGKVKDTRAGDRITPQNAHELNMMYEYLTDGYIGTGFLTVGHPIAFSPDGTLLAGGSKSVMLVEVATGELITEFETDLGGVSSVAFSPDGRLLAAGALATARRGEIILWDLTTQEELFRLDVYPNATLDIAFSPDGKSLAAGIGNVWSFSGSTQLWDVNTGALKAEYGQGESTVWDVAFSPDGTLLAAVSSDCTIQLWEVARDQLKTSLTLAPGDAFMCVEHITFRADGTVLVAHYHYGWSGGAIQLWDVTKGEKLTELQGDEKTYWKRMAFSPDGGLVATSAIEPKGMQLWDVSTGAVVARSNTYAGSMVFSPDGSLLAGGGDKIRIWGVPGDP